MFVCIQVVLLLGACPFPERLDLPWFSTALAALGPRFHSLSVRVALAVPRPAARTAAVLRAAGEGGVAVDVVLDELCPLPAGGGSGVWSGGEVLANQVRVGRGRGALNGWATVVGLVLTAVGDVAHPLFVIPVVGQIDPSIDRFIKSLRSRSSGWFLKPREGFRGSGCRKV